jgi:uncharacterized membrane protein YdbT with pleckstrin-like domain
MLLPEEKLVLSADLHPLVAFAPLALPLAGAAVVFLAFLGTGFLAGVVAAMVIFGLVGGPLAIAGWLRLRTTEFALTTRRVIMITGVIQRHSREILIDQVEGVGVTQSLLDRLLASGSLVVTGTGAGQTPIGGIRDAYEVRRKVASWLEANRVR